LICEKFNEKFFAFEVVTICQECVSLQIVKYLNFKMHSSRLVFYETVKEVKKSDSKGYTLNDLPYTKILLPYSSEFYQSS